MSTKEDDIKLLMSALVAQTNKQWSSEEELRLIWLNILDIKYLRCNIDKRCFKAVYYGRNMSIEQR